MDDMPGFALDETAFSPRVDWRLIALGRPLTASHSTVCHKVHRSPSEMPATSRSSSSPTTRTVSISARQPSFITGSKQAKLKFPEAACSCRTLRPLASNTSEWVLDLTDSGATTLLPSYAVDVWVSGSDEAGNPYDTVSNSMSEPFASWPLALVGPRVDLQDPSTSMQWDVPSPYVGDTSKMVVNTNNLGGNVMSPLLSRNLLMVASGQR